MEVSQWLSRFLLPIGRESKRLKKIPDAADAAGSILLFSITTIFAWPGSRMTSDSRRVCNFKCADRSLQNLVSSKMGFHIATGVYELNANAERGCMRDPMSE